MDKIKAILSDVDILEWSITESGGTPSKKVYSTWLTYLAKIKKDLRELEKINNYNLASSPSPTNEGPHKEMVSHPDHYQGTKIECIDAMLDVFGKEKVSAFCELNAFKYQWRADKKGTDIQDKLKAIWYLDKYVELNKEKQ